METAAGIVKRKFVLEGLDCANCAMKIENGVQNIDGVSACSVNFVNKTLTMEMVMDRSEEILEQTKKKSARWSLTSKYWSKERRELNVPITTATAAAMIMLTIAVPKRLRMDTAIPMTTGRKALKSWSPAWLQVLSSARRRYRYPWVRSLS